MPAKKQTKEFKDLPLIAKIAIFGIPAVLILREAMPSFQDVVDIFDTCQSSPENLPFNSSGATAPPSYIRGIASALFTAMDNPFYITTRAIVFQSLLDNLSTQDDWAALNNYWKSSIDNQGESVYCWVTGELLGPGQETDIQSEVLNKMSQYGLAY